MRLLSAVLAVLVFPLCLVSASATDVLQDSVADPTTPSETVSTEIMVDTSADITLNSYPYGWLQGGYFVELETYNEVQRIYVVADAAVDAFALDSEDYLVNITSNTLYGIMPDLIWIDGYTGLVRWEMFGTLQAQLYDYRDNGSIYYYWEDFGGYAPTMYNIQILEADPPTRIPDYAMSVVGIGAMVFCAIILIIFKRG